MTQPEKSKSQRSATTEGEKVPRFILIHTSNGYMIAGRHEVGEGVPVYITIGNETYTNEIDAENEVLRTLGGSPNTPGQ